MATLFSDSFTAADTTNMGANYTESSGDTQILTNRIRMSANNPGILRTTTTAHAAIADVKVTCTITTGTTGNDGGPVARVVNGGASPATSMYALEAWTSGAQGKLDIGRYDAGALVNLSTTNITITAGAIVALEVSGTVAGAVTLKAYYNGVLLKTTVDSSPSLSLTAATQTGIHNWSPAGTGSDYDDFLVENASTGGAGTVGIITRPFHPGKSPGRGSASIRFFERPGSTTIAATAQQYTQSYTAGLSFSASMPLMTGKGLTGGLTFIGSTTKFTSRTLTGGLSFSGSTTKFTTKFLTGGLSFVGATTKRTLRALTGGLSFVGSMAKTTLKTLTAGLSFSGSISRFTSRALNAGLSFVGSTVKQTARALSASLSFVGLTVPSHLFVVAMTAALSFIGAVVKQTSRTLTGGLSFSGSFSRFTSHLLTATLSFSGSLGKLTLRALNAVLNFVGTTAKRTSRTFAAGLSFSGNVSKMTLKSLNAGLAFSGSVAKRTAKFLAGGLSFVGTFVPFFISGLGGTLYTLAFTAGLSFSGTVGKLTKRSLIATLGTSGSSAGADIILIGNRLAKRITARIYEWLR